MIINRDVNPERNLYYIGSLILDELSKSSQKSIDFIDLYQELNKSRGISMNLFTLSLDWLYLNEIIELSKGKIVKCF